MAQFSICKNARCRFVLDRRVNGKSSALSASILKACPACGSAWSSDCPLCGEAIAIKLNGSFPRTVCCGRTLPIEGLPSRPVPSLRRTEAAIATATTLALPG